MIFGAINKIIVILLPFIVRTAMMRVLGAEYLGLNSLCHSILSVLNLAEMGLNSAIIFSLYKPVAIQDKKTICALLAFYKKVYRIIGIIILAGGVAAIPFLGNLIKGEVPQEISLSLVYLVFLLNTVISYLFFAYKNALLTAYQRNDLISKISALCNLLLNVLQLVLLFCFENYYLCILVMPVITMLNNFITAYIVNKKFPMYKPEGKLEKEVLCDIKKRVQGLMIQKICVITRNSLDSIVISAFIGLVSVTKYTNYYYIMSSIHNFLYIITDGIAASVGNSIATESVEKNHSDLEKFVFLYSWISGWCTVCLFCLYQPFMEIWMGKDMMLSLLYVGLFCLYFYVLTMGDILSIYSQGAGLWWEGRYRAALESLLNVVLNIILAKYFGVAGVICATLISMILVSTLYGSFIVFKYYFAEKNQGIYLVKHLLYFGVTVLVTGVSYGVCRCVQGSALFKLMIRGIICVFLPNILYFAFYARTKIFRQSFKLAWKMFSKN